MRENVPPPPPLARRREQAVGLDKFETAEIHANLILGKREIRVGEEIDLEIEMTNIGKGPVQLIKVEDLVPEGFSVISAPDNYKVESNSINLKRTLPPLMTEEVKLVVKPQEKGDFNLKPKILYFDETGTSMHLELEQITVVVRGA